MADTSDRPHRTGHAALDFVIAGCAVVISLASLWVALRADQTQEQLLKSSVWPYVEMDTSNATQTGERRLAFEMTNAGVGPAIIRSFAVAYHGHYYRTLDEFLKACCEADPRADGVLSSTVHDRVIMPHETVQWVLVYPAKTNPQIYKRIAKSRRGLTENICYCSVLNECWNFNTLTDSQPQPVSACTPAKIPYTT